MKTKLTLAVLVLSAAGSVAPAAGADRVRIVLNGAFDTGSLDYAESHTFKAFAEEGKIDTEYSTSTGKGFELGLHWRFKGHLGVMASVASTNRDGTASVSASLPHPLYLNQPRQATTTQEGLSYRETTIHVDFVYTISSGKSLEFFLFAGPSFVKVKSDLVTQLNYNQSYPYDEVTVTGVDLSNVSNNVVGFNVGAGLDFRIGKNFGLGAQVRYTTASVKLAPPEGSTISIDAGGFQAAVGVRLFF